MRRPDVTIDAQTNVWHVPMDRLSVWVDEHPEVVFMGSRGERFKRLWRDLWYMSVPVSGGDYDDALAERAWLAICLIDLRGAADYPVMYREAEWELRAQPIEGTEPPVNGDGLFESVGPPWFVYHFHGLPEETVLRVGRNERGEPESFAIFGWQALARGKRPIQEVCALLSLEVNAIRQGLGLRPLEIGEGDPLFAQYGLDPTAGLLIETEDGTPTTRPFVVSRA